MTQDRDRKALDIQTITFLFFRRVAVWPSDSNLTWPHFHDYLVDQKGILGKTWHMLFIPRLVKHEKSYNSHQFTHILNTWTGWMVPKRDQTWRFFCCTARCCMSCWWAPIPLMVSEIQSMHKFETPLQVRWNWWTFDISVQRCQLEATRSFYFFEVRGHCIENSVNKFKRASTFFSSSVRGFLRTGQRVLPWQPQVSRQWESTEYITTINHNDDWQVIQGELGDQQDQGIGSTAHFLLNACCPCREISTYGTSTRGSVRRVSLVFSLKHKEGT